MGYFTYRVFKDIELEQLQEKVSANLALFDDGTPGSELEVRLIQGKDCSAAFLHCLGLDSALFTVGSQLGCVWMDVRFQDGDWWDLTIHDGTEHVVSHSVNPWEHDEEFRYNQKAIDHRIKLICETWPDIADTLRPYLLLWKRPIRRFGFLRLTRRYGKACDTDAADYGNAYQIYDFIGAFGINSESPSVELGAGGVPE